MSPCLRHFGATASGEPVTVPNRTCNIQLTMEQHALKALKKRYNDTAGTVPERRKRRKKAWSSFRDEVIKTDKKTGQRNKPKQQMTSALQQAIESGNVQDVRQCLSKNPALIHSATEDGGYTGMLLYLSVWLSSALACRNVFLIVHAVLHLAVLYGQLDTLKWLQGNTNVREIVDCASQSGSTAMVRVKLRVW